MAIERQIYICVSFLFVSPSVCESAVDVLSRALLPWPVVDIGSIDRSTDNNNNNNNGDNDDDDDDDTRTDNGNSCSERSIELMSSQIGDIRRPILRAFL